MKTVCKICAILIYVVLSIIDLRVIPSNSSNDFDLLDFSFEFEILMRFQSKILQQCSMLYCQ